MEQSDSCAEPLNEKAESRPAICECGEQSLQETSLREGTAIATAREALKDETEFILSGDLEIDNPALEGDRDSMCSIAGAELGQDVGDAALDGCLGNEQAISNLLVGIPGGNQQ